MTELTNWQIVLQSQLLHPDWSAEIHAGYLRQEGRQQDEATIAEWLKDNVDSGRIRRMSIAHGIGSKPEQTNWPPPGSKRLRPLGQDDAPHCRHHLQFRSECAECVSAREFK